MTKKKKTFMGINPKHEGYCTPMSKSTCTPRRKALAKRLKPGGDLYKGKKKQYGGPLKQLNDMQFAKRGKAVGSILEGGRIKYDTGGETLEQAATKKMLHKDIPDLVDRMHLRDKGYHKNPSYAKSAIKAQLRRTKEDSLFGTTPLEKGTDTYKAIKEIFKEEKKKGTYSKKAYKRKYK